MPAVDDTTSQTRIGAELWQVLARHRWRRRMRRRCASVRGTSCASISTSITTPGGRLLVDVNLHIAAGTTVAVVGRSGSGKPTLARLLLRYYDPGSGRILIDGQDIALVAAASVRAAICVVPLKYGTPVGERGVNVSGGEKQRIAIAAPS